MNSLSKLPSSLRQLVILFSPNSTKPNINTKYQKILVTVSISAIGLSIAFSYFYTRFKSFRKKRTITKIIETIPELKSKNVKISDPDYVEMMLQNFVNSGKERLQVVSDFDRTISLCSYNGQPCLTSNAVIEMSPFVSSDLRTKFKELREYYLSIEHNVHMSKAEKLPYMIEWWTKSLDLVVKTQIESANLKDIVRNSTTHLKNGCKWFFHTLERHEVPLLIFSAGIGNIIEEWIVQECGSYKNMTIVSNFMTFDETTKKINGFSGSLIHIFNKNEGVLLDTKHEASILNRPNVILLGDSLGDTDMANGFPSLNHVLKIGFLNDKVEEQLPKYMEAFDIVIIKDDTFIIPNAILRSII
ncbi:cytosolic 5 -nucleotidase 3A isoform X1 [Brachionus plicatilis]|uniref:5'-nucleotidase n=1 Tax=Brachionus plicatilis TaxID=10195 RepID=A0A3M7QLI2_BRAPC|nr:cytosolic 5 -nucleotidase 3A isoform X1 [Brachionus plicatilis]